MGATFHISDVAKLLKLLKSSTLEQECIIEYSTGVRPGIRLQSIALSGIVGIGIIIPASTKPQSLLSLIATDNDITHVVRVHMDSLFMVLTKFSKMKTSMISMTFTDSLISIEAFNSNQRVVGTSTIHTLTMVDKDDEDLMVLSEENRKTLEYNISITMSGKEWRQLFSTEQSEENQFRYNNAKGHVEYQTRSTLSNSSIHLHKHREYISLSSDFIVRTIPTAIQMVRNILACMETKPVSIFLHQELPLCIEVLPVVELDPTIRIYVGTKENED